MEPITPPKTANPDIVASWQRSRAYGVDPHRPCIVPYDPTEQRRRCTINRDLIEVAHSLMEKLFAAVKDSVYILTLHDGEGYLLDFVSRDGSYIDWEHCVKRSGVKWTEETVGTNGVGLALVTDAPACVVGPEHYSQVQQDRICVAAPIHDSRGRVLGCLNMSGPVDMSNSHFLGLVLFGAQCIESQLAMRLSYETVDTTMEMISESLLIFDQELRALRSNTCLRKLFFIRDRDLLGVPIDSIIDVGGLQEQLRRSRDAIHYLEQECRLGRKTVSCNVTITPMHDGDRFVGAVMLLRESKALARITNILSGNSARYTFADIVTTDKNLLSLIEMMKHVAVTDGGILIEGESGTGKELFAHAIHSHSNRRGNPFIAVNCASLPRDLVESELFGYEKGAFTGGLRDGNPGKFELADGGTIFLDEIGELPLEIQSKLLRVLDTHRISRIGGKNEKELNIRVVAATNRDLLAEVRNRNFREDLYYRLNVFRFYIPPLRERLGDIAVLAEKFVDNLNRSANIKAKTAGKDFIGCLERYSWPGNVRELQHIIVRSYYCCRGDDLSIDLLPDDFPGRSPGSDEHGQTSVVAMRSSRTHLEEAERRCIVEALLESGGDAVLAARNLGISKATIYRRMQKYRLAGKRKSDAGKTAEP
ncbi:MAG: sigma 54-interacting transcriptional regulator [Planctomycetaceae bacterium]|nr:sigma 54-interacting transcriptional regulator [Planctomycetaceae bacterium]